VLAELGMVFADARNALADSASHTGTCALGGGARPPIATTEADRACELSHQELTLGVRLRLPIGVLARPCLLDVLFDLGQPSAVSPLGPLVEHLPSVAWCALLPCFSGGQVQNVELAAGVGEKLREIPHALEIPDAHRAPLEYQQPVVAFTAEDVRLSGDTRRNFDPIEDRPRCL
jgi:hypothetical protein